ncbi:MAG: hypothetical protein Q9221_001508 [Calogaya cf. arnoldii]
MSTWERTKKTVNYRPSLPFNYPSTKILTAPNRRFPDPWVTHSPGHISTWEFYGIHGHLPHHPALQAWRAAYRDFETKHAAGKMDERMGTQVRHWVGKEGDMVVDMVLEPREEMTWRMLGESWRGATALICMGGRGFQFLVMTEGVEGEVGLGECKLMMVNGDAGGRKVERGEVDARKEVDGSELEGMSEDERERRTKRAVGLRLPAPDVVRLAGGNDTALTAVPDPFLYHDDGMVTTWSFFGYFGHLDPNAAATAARSAYYVATQQFRPDSPIGGTKTWTGVYRDAEPVAFVLITRSTMTWRMLAEGITGAQMVVGNKKEFRFVVFADGVQGPVGFGYMKRASSSNITGARNGTGSDATWPTDLAAALEEVAAVKADAEKVNV